MGAQTTWRFPLERLPRPIGFSAHLGHAFALISGVSWPGPPCHWQGILKAHFGRPTKTCLDGSVPWINNPEQTYCNKCSKCSPCGAARFSALCLFPVDCEGTTSQKDVSLSDMVSNTHFAMVRWQPMPLPLVQPHSKTQERVPSQQLTW